MKKFILSLLGYPLAFAFLIISEIFGWLSDKINLKRLEIIIDKSPSWFVLVILLVFIVIGTVASMLATVFAGMAITNLIFLPIYLGTTLLSKLCFLFILPRVIEIGNDKLMLIPTYPWFHKWVLKIINWVKSLKYYIALMKKKQEIIDKLKIKRVKITDYLHRKKVKIFGELGLEETFFTRLKRIVVYRAKRMKRKLKQL